MKKPVANCDDLYLWLYTLNYDSPKQLLGTGAFHFKSHTIVLLYQRVTPASALHYSVARGNTTKITSNYQSPMVKVSTNYQFAYSKFDGSSFTSHFLSSGVLLELISSFL